MLRLYAHSLVGVVVSLTTYQSTNIVKLVAVVEMR